MKDLRGQCQVLLWEDEFNSDTLNTNKWNVELDNSGGGNNELQFYTPRDTNIYVQDGRLIIRALKEEYENRNYTSAKITTKGIADWRYGRIESKIRLPQGQWNSFFLKLLPKLSTVLPCFLISGLIRKIFFILTISIFCPGIMYQGIRI
ncbi:MAG: glycoside hydrolase family 16 protein [Bacteroidota bacterium]